MPRVAPKHPLAVRATHWVNGPTLLVMIWSGLLIYWAYDPYQIVVGDTVLVQFFAQWFYDALDLNNGLALGRAYHFLFGWLFALNGLVYVAYTFWSGYWRHLKPDRRTPIDAARVALHDLRLVKERPPQGIFNAAQKLSYIGVITMGAGSVLTGLAILKSVQLGWLTYLLGGYQTARLIHFTLTILYVLFFVVHVAQVAKAGWNNFRAMVAGYEIVPTTGGFADGRPTVSAEAAAGPVPRA